MFLSQQRWGCDAGYLSAVIKVCSVCLFGSKLSLSRGWRSGAWFLVSGLFTCAAGYARLSSFEMTFSFSRWDQLIIDAGFDIDDCVLKGPYYAKAIRHSCTVLWLPNQSCPVLHSGSAQTPPQTNSAQNWLRRAHPTATESKRHSYHAQGEIGIGTTEVIVGGDKEDAVTYCM